MNDRQDRLPTTLWYMWGLAGLAALLIRALGTIVPEAARHLVSVRGGTGWLLVLGCVGAMIWAEGIRGFQRRLVPHLISRAQAIATSGSNWERLLAPLASLELLLAPWARLARRWVLLVVIALMIMATHHMGERWRGTLLCGVAAGLGWGLGALAVLGWRHAARQARILDPPTRPQGKVSATVMRPGTAQPR